MSMPTITTSPNPISMSQAITDLIESIALEETALSHILNAEGEKLQKVLAMEDVSLNQILDVNETVMNMVTTVNVWSKNRFMFAAQQVSSFGSGASQRLVCSVDNIPFTGDVLCFWHCCRHEWYLLFHLYRIQFISSVFRKNPMMTNQRSLL